jgi:hypothetical protein
VKRLSNWGRGGADDEIGTASFITPDVVLTAARLVTRAGVEPRRSPRPADIPRPEPAAHAALRQERAPRRALDNVACEDGVSMLALHPTLIRDVGLTVGEPVWLDDLARVCAADSAWEFTFVGQPLRLTGGVGSPINPLAIR